MRKDKNFGSPSGLPVFIDLKIKIHPYGSFRSES
jgi:hypothetical protein